MLLLELTVDIEVFQYADCHIYYRMYPHQNYSTVKFYLYVFIALKLREYCRDGFWAGVDKINEYIACIIRTMKIIGEK
jgi:hypothetical protein